MADQAVLLAAGQAERLMPLTESRPKAMLLVGGKPLLQHAVEALREHGITDVTIVVGRHGQKIQSFFKDGADFGVSIQYAQQAEPRGTTEALRVARPFLEEGRDVWALSGAVFVTREILAPLAKAAGDAVVVAPAGDLHEQPVPLVRGRRLEGVRWETPALGATRVITGLMRFRWETYASLEDEPEPEAEQALGRRASEGAEVAVVETQGPWHRIIEPWDVLRLNGHVLDRLPRPGKRFAGAHVQGAVHIGANATVARTATIVGPVTIGDGCTVGDYTVVGPYVSIRNNTIVGSHCEVRHSILNNNVQVDSRCLVRGSVLDDGVQVGPGFIGHETSTAKGPVGCILGRDARVGAGARAEGGAVLAPEGSVAAGGLLR